MSCERFCQTPKVLQQETVQDSRLPQKLTKDSFIVKRYLKAKNLAYSNFSTRLRY